MYNFKINIISVQFVNQIIESNKYSNKKINKKTLKKNYKDLKNWGNDLILVN